MLSFYMPGPIKRLGKMTLCTSWFIVLLVHVVLKSALQLQLFVMLFRFSCKEAIE